MTSLKNVRNVLRFGRSRSSSVDEEERCLVGSTGRQGSLTNGDSSEQVLFQIRPPECCTWHWMVFNPPPPPPTVFPKVYVFGHIRESIKFNLAIFLGFLTFCIVLNSGEKLSTVPPPNHWSFLVLPFNFCISLFNFFIWIRWPWEVKWKLFRTYLFG